MPGDARHGQCPAARDGRRQRQQRGQAVTHADGCVGQCHEDREHGGDVEPAPELPPEAGRVERRADRATVVECFNPSLKCTNLLAVNLPLLFRIAHLRERREKLLFHTLDRDRARAQRVEHAAHEFRFALAHQPCIHVNAAHAFGAQRAQA